MTIDHLSTPHIYFLNAIINNEESLHSSKIIQKYKLGTSSNVTRIKSALEKKEIIDINNGQIELNDPAFGLWLHGYFQH